MDSREIVSGLSGSGFPFQTAVAAAIQATNVFAVEEEVAWKDDTGAARFLDIVASKDSVRICIECKALRKSALVFLIPKDREIGATRLVRAVFLNRVEDSTRRPIVDYGVCATDNESRESMYCVICGDQEKGGRLIEREAQPLIQGTEQYAIDRVHDYKQAGTTVCIPVLCTTAQLFVAEYDPAMISLQDGVYKAAEDHLTRVPYIRFTKQFSADSPDVTRNRTVVVVQATELSNLLGGLTRANVVHRTAKIFDSMTQGRNPRFHVY